MRSFFEIAHLNCGAADMKPVLVLSFAISLCYTTASPTDPPSDSTTGDGEQAEGERRPRNRAPITGHNLRVVIGVSVGCLISLLLLICLELGRRIRNSCDSASYPVRELEIRQRQRVSPITIFINPGLDHEGANGEANTVVENGAAAFEDSQPWNNVEGRKPLPPLKRSSSF